MYTYTYTYVCRVNPGAFELYVACSVSTLLHVFLSYIQGKLGGIRKKTVLRKNTGGRTNTSASR